MIQSINSITPTLTRVMKNPKTTMALAAGTLAVLSTHQVWPHPESPRTYDHVDFKPDTVDDSALPDIDPEKITPFGDIVADDNIVNLMEHLSDSVTGTLTHVSDFLGDLFGC